MFLNQIQLNLLHYNSYKLIFINLIEIIIKQNLIFTNIYQQNLYISNTFLIINKLFENVKIWPERV